MAERKTQRNDTSVSSFIAGIADAKVRADCRTIAGIMAAATKAKGKMWGTAIVGFGEREVEYAGGKTATWMQMGFSPRKQNIALYGLGIAGQSELLDKLGDHDTGKGCLYIKRLSDVSVPVLTRMIRESAKGGKQVKRKTATSKD
jgi:hypothetical protein